MLVKEILYCMLHPISMAKMNFSFSQEGEDVIIKNLLGNVEKKGIYVDIGAHHPMRFSNTFYFYLHGWTGINVDAMPGSMKKFNKYRKKDINLEAGISNTGEELVFYEFTDGALNTFDAKLAQKYEGNGYKVINQQSIQTYKIMDILDQYVGEQEIDIMDIDIEGMDDLIIGQIDWQKYRPKIVLAEKDYNLATKDVRPNRVLCENGYMLAAMTRLTGIYVLKESLNE